MEGTAAPSRLSRAAQFGFVGLMAALMAVFVILGTWQLQRLAEKETLIATVEARINDAPIAFPAAAIWPALDPDDLDYRPYRLTGVFEEENSVSIFTNLTDPQGAYGGVGYWIMTPFRLEDGGRAWVNRGFVPEPWVADYLSAVTPSGDRVTIAAVARRPERAGSFTPPSDLSARREWVRDPGRLAAFLPDPAVPVAPVTFDLPAGPEGSLPQGGETQVNFPNRHLEYAGTWYLFAAMTPVLLGFWLWGQRRRNLAPSDKAH